MTPGVLSWATAAGEAMRLVSPLARGKYPSRSSLGEISLLRLLESCAAPLATPCTTRSAFAAANLRALDSVLWTACSALRSPPCVLWTACSALHAPPCVLGPACSSLRAPLPRRGRLCQAADATAHCLLELSYACSPPCFCSARLVCSRAVSSAASTRLGSSWCLSSAWLVAVLISSGVLGTTSWAAAQAQSTLLLSLSLTLLLRALASECGGGTTRIRHPHRAGRRILQYTP